jgi:recombination protein RecA
MAARAKLEEAPKAPKAREPLGAPAAVERATSGGFISSGSCLLDLVLGGGWASGRIINIVGDRSSGKTLLVVEAAAQFARFFPGGKAHNARYVDAESAFDSDYQRIMGFPKGVQECETGMETVEEFFADLTQFLDRLPAGQPGLYILDSLDALSDSAEMARELDDGKTYGTAKAKKLSETFRRITGRLDRQNCTLIIISQIRDKIGVTFGETKTRSGGKALDFYCSQIVWLAEKNKIKRTVLGEDRPIGIVTVARTKKNKVGLPFRKCELEILFNYGIDDEQSMLNWLDSTTPGKTALKNALEMDAKKLREEIALARKQGEAAILDDITEGLREITQSHWRRIDDLLAPPTRKYD